MVIKQEIQLRNNIFTSLISNNLAPIARSRANVNSFTKKNFGIEIHKGERGVWRDSKRTTRLMGNQIGIAVSIHSVSESQYADEHALESIRYSFPQTKAITHDVREIEAVNIAFKYEVPLFIFVGPKGGDKILRKGLISSIDKQEQFWTIQVINEKF